MKETKAKLIPVFKTIEEEKLFSRCTEESMHKYAKTHLSFDETLITGASILSPAFKTKEEEKLFERYTNEKSKTLNKSR